MKYQIQLYNESDQSAQRELIAETEGDFTEEAVGEWYSSVMASTSLTEGFKPVVVTPDHPWFIQRDNEPEGLTNVPPQKNEVKPIEGDQVQNDEVLKSGIARMLEERKRKYEEEN